MIKKVLLLFTMTVALWLTGVAAQNSTPPVAQASLTDDAQSITGAQQTGTTDAAEQESATEEIADVLEAIDGIDLSTLDVIDGPTPNPTPPLQPSVWDKLNLLKLYLLVELDVTQEKIKQHYHDNKNAYLATAGAASTVALAWLAYYLYKLSQTPLTFPTPPTP